MLPTADGTAWEEWGTFKRWSLAGGCGSPVGGLGDVFWPTPPVHSVSRPQIQCDKANLLRLPSEMECAAETSVQNQLLLLWLLCVGDFITAAQTTVVIGV